MNRDVKLMNGKTSKQQMKNELRIERRLESIDHRQKVKKKINTQQANKRKKKDITCNRACMGRNIHLINDKGYTGALDLLDILC